MVEMRHQLAARERWADAGMATPERGAPPARFAEFPARVVSRSGSAATRDTDASAMAAALARAIRNEVLPRLALAHRAMTAPIPPMAGWSDPVIELERLVLARDESEALAFVSGLAAGGASMEAIYLDVLAPTACRLGALWEHDVRDIAEVSIGLWRLTELMRELRPAFLSEAAFSDHGRAALLVPAPGETHTFGLAMVSDFFTRAGWNVAGGPTASAQDLGNLVCDRWFAIVGFSAGCDASLDALAAAILIVRRRSRNRAVGVMVGGPIFALRPELAARVGADATATDGRQAVTQARSLVTLVGARTS